MAAGFMADRRLASSDALGEAVSDLLRSEPTWTDPRTTFTRRSAGA
jgi:hypothetical protein